MAKPESVIEMNVTHENLLRVLWEGDDDEILLALFMRKNKCAKFEIGGFMIYINKQPFGWIMKKHIQSSLDYVIRGQNQISRIEFKNILFLWIHNLPKLRNPHIFLLSDNPMFTSGLWRQNRDILSETNCFNS